MSVIGGWVGIPHVIGDVLGHVPNLWESWLAPLITKLPSTSATAHSANEEWILMGSSVTLAAISAVSAYIIYVKKEGVADKIARATGPVFKVIDNKYFVDEAYFAAIINPLVQASRNLWHFVDVNVVDKATYKITEIVRGGGFIVRSLQNGNLQQYAMYVVLGVVVALSYMLVG